MPCQVKKAAICRISRGARRTDPKAHGEPLRILNHVSYRHDPMHATGALCFTIGPALSSCFRGRITTLCNISASLCFFYRLNIPSALSCLTLDPSQSISSTSAIPLRRRAHRQYHLLHALHPHLLHRGTHSNCHVVEKWRMALIGSVAVTGNVGSPFVFCGVGMPSSNVFVLEGLELLLGT